MATTLRKLAYIIYNDLNGGHGGSNERIAIAQIEEEIHLMRARLIYEQSKASVLVMDPALYSSVNCIKLEKRDLSESPDLDTKNLALHTYVPAFLQVAGKHFVQYVTSPDKQTRFRIRFGLEDMYWRYEPATKNNPTAIIQDNSLWLFNPPSKMQYVSIRAIFENAGQLDSEDDGFSCTEGEQKYPIPDYMADMITGKILEGKIRNAVRLRPDPTNTQSDKN